MSLPKITIGKGELRKFNNSLEIDLRIYNPMPIKISTIKLNIFFYSAVLSNPRFESLDSYFQNHDQVLKQYETDKCNIYLVAKTPDVIVIPTDSFLVLGTLKFDRVLNANPVSYGVNAFESYINEISLVPSQISL